MKQQHCLQPEDSVGSDSEVELPVMALGSNTTSYLSKSNQLKLLRSN